MVRFSFLSLPVVAVLIGALTAGVVVLGRWLNLGVYGLLLLAVPIAIALAYLVWYSKLPYEPPTPRARPAAPGAAAEATPDEPFEDPVEEADRYETELKDEGDVDDEESPPPPSPDLDDSP